jgi:GTP pyrophosphokinase
MIRFEDIYETVKRHHPGADLELLRKAYIFSAVEHKGQTRASGEPYLVHPLEVAAILADMRMDPACVAVGLLHDVLEDTLTSPDRIKDYFGEDVLHIVEGVTKISKMPFTTSEERQAETYRKMLLAMVDDIRVILVKLADRLHNMRTLQFLPTERRVKIARIHQPSRQRIRTGSTTRPPATTATRPASFRRCPASRCSPRRRSSMATAAPACRRPRSTSTR